MGSARRGNSRTLMKKQTFIIFTSKYKIKRESGYYNELLNIDRNNPGIRNTRYWIFIRYKSKNSIFTYYYYNRLAFDNRIFVWCQKFLYQTLAPLTRFLKWGHLIYRDVKFRPHNFDLEMISMNSGPIRCLLMTIAWFNQTMNTHKNC